MTVNIDKLRDDIKNELYAAFFGGEFGGALVSAFDIDKMSDEEIIEYALKNHMDLYSFRQKSTKSLD